MDTEGLKSLAWILIFGGLFFFMMRSGCGAHIGGHSHGSGHGEGAAQAPGENSKDPVCGMSIDPQRAAAAAVHGGKTYYFCSNSCRDKFEQAPEKYITMASHATSDQGAHHHG